LRRGFPFAVAGLGDGERQVSTSLAFPRDHLIVFFRSMPTLAKILFALAVLLSFTGYVSPPAALTAGMVFGLSFHDEGAELLVGPQLAGEVEEVNFARRTKWDAGCERSSIRCFGTGPWDEEVEERSVACPRED